MWDGYYCVLQSELPSLAVTLVLVARHRKTWKSCSSLQNKEKSHHGKHGQSWQVKTTEEAGGEWLMVNVFWVKTKKTNLSFHCLYSITWTKCINKRICHRCWRRAYTAASDHSWNSLLGGYLPRLQRPAQPGTAEGGPAQRAARGRTRAAAPPARPLRGSLAAGERWLCSPWAALARDSHAFGISEQGNR